MNVLQKDSSEIQLLVEDARLSTDKAVTVFIGMALFICVLLSESALFTYFSIATLIVFMVWMFLNYTIVYFKYLHFIFGGMIAIGGCVVIEFTDVRLIEIGDYSSYVGSIPLLVFSWWVFYVSLISHDKWMVKRQSERECIRTIKLRDYFKVDNKNIVAYGAACIGCLLILYIFFLVLKNPSFLLEMDRFQYAKEFDYGFLYSQSLRLLKYLILPVIVVAIYKKSKIAWIALGVYCLYGFWVGNKFGLYFSLLCLFTMLYSPNLKNAGRGNMKKIIAIMLMLVFLVAVAVFGVSFTRVEGSSNYLIPRLAQQGQLWWKTYGTTDKWHISEFGDEIESLQVGTNDIAENVGAQYGIYKNMYYTATFSTVNNKLQSGSRYTEAGFAEAYYYLGIPGCIIFAVLGGILVSFFVNSFLYYIRYNQYVRAFIYYRFYTNMAVLMSMFIFFPFFNKASILSYAILFVFHNKILKIEKTQV